MTCQELLRKPTFSWLPRFHFWTVLLQNSNVNRQAIVPTYVLYFHVKNLEYTIYALSSICIFCKGTIYLVLFSFRKINFLQLKNDPFLNYIASPFSMYVCSLPICVIWLALFSWGLILQSGVVAKCLLRVMESEEKQKIKNIPILRHYTQDKEIHLQYFLSYNLLLKLITVTVRRLIP